jgi:hypothetical protein
MEGNKMPHPTTPAVVRHPVTGEPTALNPAVDYADDDPIVEAYGWAFQKRTISEPVDSVRIEQATAAPGEKRNRSRGK